MLLVLFWVFNKTLDQYSQEDLLSYQKSYFVLSNRLWWMVIVLALMPINWWCESRKWSISLAHLVHLSTNKSLKSVFSGVSLGIFTPNRIGEFAGRILTIPYQYRKEGLFSNALCSISQFITTLVFGIAALVIAIPEYMGNEFTLYSAVIRGLCVLLIFILLLFYFRSNLMLNALSKVKWIQKILNQPVFQIELPNSILAKILSISVLRYFIFTTQYLLVLHYFDVPIFSFYAIVHISIVYLTITIIPSLALSKLGIRESIAVAVLGGIVGNELGIISATFCLWIINIAIPGIIGSVILFSEWKTNKAS